LPTSYLLLAFYLIKILGKQQLSNASCRHGGSRAVQG
jgi:hypothetical protein